MAVEAETTWKGVASTLGLAQSSTPRLRRHAARLGLDTSHFTGRRRWSDVDLKSAVASSSSWSELLHRLDVGDTSETRLYVKGHAARLGVDVGRLNGARRVVPTTWECVTRPVNVGKHLRLAAESIAVAWFTMRRMTVAIPTEAMPYDLVVWFAHGPQRVQVKSGAYRRSDGSWKVSVGQRPYVLDATAETAPYNLDGLDYFFIIDGDGLIYLLPSSDVAGRTSINVGGYMQHRVGTASSLLERN
jgi:hypothetical protein